MIKEPNHPAGTVCLCDLRDGEWGRVCSLDGSGALKQRLMDIGLIEGTRVRRLYAAPSGDPAAYWVRGTVIALRRGDGRGIAVKRFGLSGERSDGRCRDEMIF